MAFKYAAPAGSGGSDSNPGTIGSPYLTVQKLMDNLNAGDTGYLRAGTYTAAGGLLVATTKGGSAGSPLTLMPYPGEFVILQKSFWIKTGHDYITISGDRRHLKIDGVAGSDGSTAVQLCGDHLILEDCEITGTAVIGVSLGSIPPFGQSNYTIIRRNFFHDIGSVATQHCIYGQDNSDCEIYDNVAVRCSGYFWHAYGRNMKASVHNNVVDDCYGGLLFSGYDPTMTTTDCTYERNLLTNIYDRPAVTYWWEGGAAGSGNIARYNVGFDNSANGDYDATPVGYTQTNNVHQDPQYLDQAAGTVDGLRMSLTSPALSTLLYDTARLISLLRYLTSVTMATAARPLSIATGVPISRTLGRATVTTSARSLTVSGQPLSRTLGAATITTTVQSLMGLLIRPPRSTAGLELYDAAAPLVEQYGDPNLALYHYCMAIGVMFDPLDAMARDQGDKPGWSQTLDLNRADVSWLRWLGQFVGYYAPINTTEADRQRLINRSAHRRGGVDPLLEVAREHLNGTQYTVLRERDSSPSHMTLYVNNAEVATTQAMLIAAVQEQKAAGLLLDVVFIGAGASSWTLLMATRANWSDVVLDFTNWVEVATDPGKP